MVLTLLKQRVLKSEIVIKPADKGSATVVWSFGDYVAEANRQLKNYRRPKNLRNLLVKVELKPCGAGRCLTCSHIQTGTNFRSMTTKQTSIVRATATCKSRNVIYLIECRKCRKQYAGETQNPLHIRLNGHRNNITYRQTEKPVTGHFNSPGHSLDDLRIAFLEVMRSFDESLRRRLEGYWIKQLRSLHPEGMNLDA